MAAKLVLLLLSVISVELTAAAPNVGYNGGSDDMEVTPDKHVSSDKHSEETIVDAHTPTDEPMSVSVLTVRSGGIESNASGWRAPFCRGAAVGAPGEDRSWGPGDEPPADDLDTLLERETGCRQALVPPYDRQPFQWHWAETSGRELQQRLAVRTVGAGRADIKIYWNNERKYYFAFSNNVNRTVEFFRYSPWELLWSIHLPPVSSSSSSSSTGSSQEERYVPLYITIEPEYIRWGVGCAREEHSLLESTTRGDQLKLEVETSAFPAKMLYNCPLH